MSSWFKFNPHLTSSFSELFKRPDSQGRQLRAGAQRGYETYPWSQSGLEPIPGSTDPDSGLVEGFGAGRIPPFGPLFPLELAVCWAGV